jgi:hypothetical protein
MTLPCNARVEATPNFLNNLATAHTFFALQEAASADARLAKLKADLRETIQILSWSPASGRPARFLAAKSAQSRLKAAAVLALAKQAGLTNLREFVVAQHIVLYAHSETEVVLLALKHQRELVYSLLDNA